MYVFLKLEKHLPSCASRSQRKYELSEFNSWIQEVPVCHIRHYLTWHTLKFNEFDMLRISHHVDLLHIKISSIPLTLLPQKTNYPKNDLATSTNQFSAKITLEKEIAKYSVFSLQRLLS